MDLDDEDDIEEVLEDEVQVEHMDISGATQVIRALHTVG